MRYLFLVYADERQWETLPAGERDTLARACIENDEALRARGYLLTAEAPQGETATATVRVQQADVCVTAGPVAKAQEQLRAVLTISARDLNEAIQVAAGMPQARLGPIEVRPLREQR